MNLQKLRDEEDVTTRGTDDTVSGIFWDASESSKGLFSTSQVRKFGTGSDRMKYKWRTNWDFIVITVAGIVSVNNFDLQVTKVGTSTDPTILHFLACFIFIGMPILFMEILIGQYTQLGASQLKYLSPISHGLGFTLLVAVFLRSFKLGLYMADCLMYFLTSFQPQLQWLVCPKTLEHKCWGQNDIGKCHHNCITENIDLSTFIYWRDVYMGGPNLTETYVDYGSPNFVRSVAATLVWFTMFIMIMYTMGIYIKIIKTNCYIVMIFLLVLFLVTFLTAGAPGGIKLIFKVEYRSLYNIRAWATGVANVIEVLGVGRAIPIMHGSYLSSGFQTGILTTGCLAMIYMTSFVFTLITYCSIGIIIRASGILINEIDVNPQSLIFEAEHVPTLFTVVPQGLGFIGACQLWSMFYFLLCFLIILNNQVIHILIIEKSITDVFPQIVRYKKYLIAIFCIIGLSMDIMLSSREVYIIGRHFTTRIVRILETFNSFLLCLFVFYIYGVQRLSDDIQFMTGSKPTKFWTICWSICPIALGFPTAYHFYINELPESTTFRILHFIFIIGVLLPIPIMLLVEIFRHLRHHNLAGILQPHERWGPSDPEERHLRHIFNPRQEIRSRRRLDFCQHNCLLGSKILRKFVDEETQMRYDFRETQIESDIFSI